MKSLCKFGSLILFAASIVLAFLFFVSLTGCVASTDPVTGKVTQKFDAPTAQKDLGSPPVQSALNSLPYGLGALISGVGFWALQSIGKHAITVAGSGTPAPPPVPQATSTTTSTAPVIASANAVPAPPAASGGKT